MVQDIDLTEYTLLMAIGSVHRNINREREGLKRMQ